MATGLMGTLGSFGVEKWGKLHGKDEEDNEARHGKL